MADLSFTIEKRAGSSVVVFKAGGCRPASSVELELWDSRRRMATQLKQIKARLDVAIGELETLTKGKGNAEDQGST